MEFSIAIEIICRLEAESRCQFHIWVGVRFPEGSVIRMARTIEDLEKDLDTMNEMFRKYMKLSSHYQKQIDTAEIPEDQRSVLMEKLAQENEKVQRAKLQIEKFEETIRVLKESRAKLKDVSTRDEKIDYLIAYN